MSQGIDPGRIMLLTFTRRASDEMLRRARRALGETESRTLGNCLGRRQHSLPFVSNVPEIRRHSYVYRDISRRLTGRARYSADSRSAKLPEFRKVNRRGNSLFAKAGVSTPPRGRSRRPIATNATRLFSPAYRTHSGPKPAVKIAKLAEPSADAIYNCIPPTQGDGFLPLCRAPSGSPQLLSWSFPQHRGEMKPLEVGTVPLTQERHSSPDLKSR